MQPSRIHIIFPTLPPNVHGVGDYTLCIARQLARSAQVTVLCGHEPCVGPIEGVDVVQAFSLNREDSIWNVVGRIAADRPNWVILQYSQFSYGRWGKNLHLPRAVRALRKCAPSTRFALMVHEPFVRVENWRFAIMTTWQRWIFYSLGLSADVVFVAIEPWTQKFRRWFPNKPVLHLPVGSNIPSVPISRHEARTRLGIGSETLVLGLFGTFQPIVMHWLVRQSAEALRDIGYDVVLLYIGPHGERTRAVLGDLPAILEGPFPGEEVSRRFAAVDIYLAAFVDGISTRRSSMMAALQHGRAVVGTKGYSTDRILCDQHEHALLMAGVSDDAGFIRHVLRLAQHPELREQMGGEAERFFDQEFNWQRIAERLLSVLTCD